MRTFVNISARTLVCVLICGGMSARTAQANDTLSGSFANAFNAIIVKPVNSAVKAATSPVKKTAQTSRNRKSQNKDDVIAFTEQEMLPVRKPKRHLRKTWIDDSPPLATTDNQAGTPTLARPPLRGTKGPERWAAPIMRPSITPPLPAKAKPKPEPDTPQSKAKTVTDKKKPAPKTEPDAKTKANAKAKTKADKKSADKTDTPTVAPKPDLTRWPESDLLAAKAKCKRLLGNLDIDYTFEEPLREGKHGQCGNAAPVRVTRVGKGKMAVKITPPARVSCDLAAAMHTWLTRDVQKLAQKHLKTNVTKLASMSDYSCRTMYGRKGAKLSEHARMNALDIRGFKLADKRIASVLRDWGVTQRDYKAARKTVEERIAEAKKKAAEAKKAEAIKAKAKKNAAKQDPNNPKTNVKYVAPISTAIAKAANDKPHKTAGEPKARPTEVKMLVVTAEAIHAALPERFQNPISPKGDFLRAIHKSACKIFGTTLGPEANEPHRNHFHIDMTVRKYRKICD